MHTVLRQSGRISIRLISHGTAQFSSSATFRSSDSTPNERDKSEQRDATLASPNAQRFADEEVTDINAGRKHGLRRTLRQRRVIDLPQPPPLPEWFLDHNVNAPRMQEATNAEEVQLLDCVDVKTGATLLSIPCREKSASFLLDISQESSDGSRDFDGDASSHVLRIDAIIQAAFALAGHSASSLTADLFLSSIDSDGAESLLQVAARHSGSHIVTIDANDIADLTGEYVGQGNDAAGTFTTLAHDVYEGRTAQGVSISGPSSFHREMDEETNEEEDDEEDDNEESENDLDAISHRIKSIKDIFESRIGQMGKSLGGMPIAFHVEHIKSPTGIMSTPPNNADRPRRRRETSDYVQWDDARLAAVLDQIIDAPQQETRKATDSDVRATPPTTQLADFLASSLAAASPQWPSSAVRFVASDRQNLDSLPQRASTIIHIKDIADICRSKLGETIIARLVKLVRKRRRLGEHVIVVGTSAAQRHTIDFEDMPFITVGDTRDHGHDIRSIVERLGAAFSSDGASMGREDRIRQINMRNIGSMLRRLDPEHRKNTLFDIPDEQLLWPHNRMFMQSVLSYDTVRELVLIAVGLAKLTANDETVVPIHISMAGAVLGHAQSVSEAEKPLSAMPVEVLGGDIAKQLGKQRRSASGSTTKKKLDDVKKRCNAHETRLLSGVVDADSIKTGFNDVHVTPETIEALKTATTLSLTRPDAFKYGVLAKDNLSGLMLYGPPGTGKTLLAKAVAKESGATVLEVSGAQVYEKYVGEGEKMVRAVFTLAKKLSPCVVFIDEADALFGARSSNSNRSTHRELINQFLREWDGMDDHKIFIMVATNRPFDMDDAVLRRLPRRLLVDLPVAKDRETILGIHLRDEQLNPEVSLAKLAEQTPLYSGSDLKNVCVSAALAAVREENELAAKHAEDEDFALPEKRTLEQRHFDKAIQEISASINEDMSSLNAIKKFDEQYGDRRGRKKKASYGFGASDIAVDENAARVRQGGP